MWIYLSNKCSPKLFVNWKLHLVGKFRIRIDRIIDLGEIELKNTTYSFNMKIKFGGNKYFAVFVRYEYNLTDCKRFYFLGKFKIRNERIIESRELVINTLPFFANPNIVVQISSPKLTESMRLYFVGNFRIRIERIIDSRELDIYHMSYLSHMEIRFEVNLLQILCPVKITNISLI